jgi:hypothetical protein
MRWLRSGFDFGVRDHEMNEPKSGYRDFPRSQAPVVDYFFLGDGIFYIGVK